jgi:hypothetical protein
MMPSPAAALPACSQLAVTAASGLGGNPVIVSPTSTIIAASGSHVAYCNVQFTYSALSGPANGYAPGESQAIRIGVGLPLNSTDGGTGGVQGAWNGKIQNLGGGGLVGSVGSTTSATDFGWIGSSTDGGHTTAQNGTVGNFGVVQASHTLDFGKINDYYLESIHQQVEWSKALASNYYGMAATRNYWNGCSTGGRQGLALAQNYGDQCDGFVVGAPAFFHDQFRLSDSWPGLVNQDYLVNQGLPPITTALYNATSASAIAACDVQGTDTVADGIIDDPRACTWSASNNICGAPGAPAAPNCVTAQQAAVIDKMWDGPRNRFGKLIWYPFDRSSPIGVGITPVPSSTGQVMAWDHADLNFGVNNLYSSRAFAAANRNGAPNPIAYEDEAQLGALLVDDLIDTQSANLDLVHNHGGKIIMWQGGADQLIRWRDSVDYYRLVATRYGNATANFAGLQSWFRYYHAPGVQHCGGGVGPNPTNVLANGNTQVFDDLVKWVEQGIPPSSAGPTTNGGMLVTGGTGAPPGRTRPICPWPTTAIYNGSGSTDVASSFTCGGNLDADVPLINPVALCKMVRTIYKHESQPTADVAEGNLDVCKGNATTYGHDFNADIQSDVLWRDSDGNVGMWLMNGTSIAQTSVLGNVPLVWAAVGQRDFNASGDSGILWRDTSGNVGMWLMNGPQIASTTVLGNVPGNWSVAATGDFNADGNGDVVWRDTAGNVGLWLMNGTTIAQTAVIGNVPTNWSIVGADMRGDIFWRNSSTGEVGMWVMIDTQVAQTVDFGVVPLNWTIAGIGDFDGNGSTDILWRDSSGNVGIWLMNGTQILSTSVLGNVPADWNVAQTGDYNGDGKSDVLWIDTSGNVGVWFMNGTTVSSVTQYGNVGTTWTPQAFSAD